MEGGFSKARLNVPTFLPAFLPVALFICPFFQVNLKSVLSEMIPKEIMKRGGILSRLVHLYEESPYKPDPVLFLI